MTIFKEQGFDVDAVVRTLDNIKCADIIDTAPRRTLAESNMSMTETAQPLYDKVAGRKELFVELAQQVLKSPTEVYFQMQSEDRISPSGFVFVAEVKGVQITVARDVNEMPDSFKELVDLYPVNDMHRKTPINLTPELMKDFIDSMKERKGKLRNNDMCIGISWDKDHSERVQVWDYDIPAVYNKPPFLQTEWASVKKSSVNGVPKVEELRVAVQEAKMPRIIVRSVVGEETDAYGQAGGPRVDQKLTYPDSESNTLRHRKIVKAYDENSGWHNDQAFLARCSPDKGWDIEQAEQGEKRISTDTLPILQEAGITQGGQQAPDIIHLHKMALMAIPE
mgnify:CR=1 FL=1